MIATPLTEYRTWLTDGLMIKKHIENICFFYKKECLASAGQEAIDSRL